MRKELFPFVGYISNPKSSVGGKRVSSAQGTWKVESKIQQEPDLWGRNSSNSDVLTPGSFSMFEVSPRTEAASFALPLKAIFCFQRQGGPVSFSGFSLSKFLKPMTIAPRVLSPVAMMLLRLWGAQCSKRLNKGHRLSQPIAGRVKMQGEKFLVCWVDVFCQANHWSMTDCLFIIGCFCTLTLAMSSMGLLHLQRLLAFEKEAWDAVSWCHLSTGNRPL